jgi:hypothetical protein
LRRFIVMRRLGLFLSLALLLALTLGCGLSGLRGGGEEPPPAEAPAGGEEAASPTEAPPGEEASEPPGGGAETEEEEEISLSSVTGGLQGLDSYRSHLKMAFEGTADGEAESGVYEMDVETVRDPFAQRIVIQGGFVGDGFESVQIGDRRYVVFGEGQCISSSTDEGDAMDAEVFEPDDVIGGLENARRVRPDERVNGIPCRHYAFDETNVAWGAFTHAEGEMWVAVDGEYVVKYTLQADGENPITGDDAGHVEWEYEIRDVNEPVTIEPPAGCDATEGEFPIMPDATDLTTMGGMVTYTSASSFDDVQAFYEEQMTADGWSDSGDSFTSPGSAMLNYAKEGRTAMITLTSEDGAVSVLIMSE